MGFFDDVVQGGGGNGGYIAQAQYLVGFKSFRKGLALNESFFAAEGVSAEQMEAALAKAKEVDPEVTARSNRAFRLTIYKDTVLNKDMSDKWAAGDRHHDIVSWTSAATEVLIPSLEENGLATVDAYGERFWAQISFKADPYQVKQGREEPDLVPYVVRTFASREEAAAAVDGDVASNGSPAANINVAAPADFDESAAGASWDTYVGEIVSALQEQVGENATPIKVRQGVAAVAKTFEGYVPQEKIQEIADEILVPF